MSSHRQIFKSTAIVGGTQLGNILVGLLRNKAMALLLGPVGVGLSGTYLTTLGMVGGITGLGLGSSGVRQVAQVSGTGNPEKFARTVLSLRRMSILSGWFGLMAGLALCIPLSRITFGTTSRSVDLAWMSLTLLLGGISSGQIALLQGLRRLADMGKAQVFGSLAGMLAGVSLVYFYRERGIVFSLIANSLAASIFSYWYAHKVKLPPVRMTWGASFREGRELVAFGAAFVVQNLLGGATGYLSRVLIISWLGLGAAGLFTATWTLSSFYVNMVLRAMGADFYPRLTESSKHHPGMIQLVNEQIEMGLLIAVPGILAILTMAPMALHLLYSGDFQAGAGIIRWQVLGVFVQVFSWPVSYILIAKGERKLFVLNEIVNMVCGLGFLVLGIWRWKLDGIGIGFFLATLASSAYVFFMGYRLIGFSLGRRCWKILGFSCGLVAVAFVFPLWLSEPWQLGFGISLTVVTGLASVLVLQKLLGFDFAKLIRSKFYN